MTSVSAALGYQLWAESYDREVNPLLALETRILLRMLQAFAPWKIADIGCGTGRWLQHFLQSGARVIGLDASPHMLARAAQKPALKGHLVLARADQLPVVDAWADLTLCSLSLAYFPDLFASFCEFARITRPGAPVIVTDLHPKALKAGWNRSFRANGTTYNIICHSRPLSSIQKAAAKTGLILEHCESVRFGAPEYKLFRQHRKETLFAEISATPALLVTEWRHRC